MAEKLRKLSIDEMKPMLVDMLQYVHNFCQEHQIQYFMYFGTLLGAVRHKGYIPWDDDIDICMTRAEYERFTRLFAAETSSRYKVLTARDKGYRYPFGKIIDTHTVLEEQIIGGECPLGIFIDVFIIDNLGNTVKQAKRFSHFVSFWYLLSRIRWTKKMRKTARWDKLLKIARILTFFVNKRAALLVVDAASKLHQGKDLTKYVGAVNASKYNERQILRGEWFREAVLMEFEGHQFYGPAAYDSVLTTIYHDYMQMPPKEKRVGHHNCRMWIKEGADFSTSESQNTDNDV